MMRPWKVSVVVAIVIILCGQVAYSKRKYHRENYIRAYATKWTSAYLPNRTLVGEDTPCGRALEELKDALMSPEAKDAWALSMVDSWGKTNDGFLAGIPHILGIYDQCLRIESPNINIRGKYCKLIKPLAPIPDEKGGDILQRINHNGESKSHSIQGRSNSLQWRGQSMEQLKEDIAYHSLNLGIVMSEWKGQFKATEQKILYTTNETQNIGSVRSGGLPVLHPNLFLTYGTCIPNVCTREQLQESVLNPKHPNQGPFVIDCDESDWFASSDAIDISKLELDAVDISFISFLSVIAAFMLAGTTVHGYILYTKKEHLGKGPLRFVLPFAISANLKKIFTINTRPSPGTISCINGMRVMSMCWVIWCHQNLYTIAAMANQLTWKQTPNPPLFMIIFNGDLSVDSFFFMSGLLVCYGVMKEINKTGRLNIIMYYIHRIIRLTPPIAVAVWYFSTLNRFTVRGPIPIAYSPPPWLLAKWCREVGWKDIVYAGNIPLDDDPSITTSCMGQCWYTAADTHLYALAPLVLLPLYYYKTLGRGWLYVVTIAAVAMRGFVTWNERNAGDGGFPWLYDNYLATWSRADAWLIGIWTGYLISNMGKKKLALKPWQVVMGWTVATVCGLLNMFAKYHSNFTGSGHIMYEMIHRTAWASCLAWVTIACHYGYGGIVNEFLSHPSWQPFSRLTYCIYLVAQEITFNYTNVARTLFYYTPINKIIETCGILFVSTIFALLLSLTVEAPVLGLEKLLLNRPGHGAQEVVKNNVTVASNSDNQLHIPLEEKRLPPGYMRHAETVAE